MPGPPPTPSYGAAQASIDTSIMIIQVQCAIRGLSFSEPESVSRVFKVIGPSPLKD